MEAWSTKHSTGLRFGRLGFGYLGDEGFDDRSLIETTVSDRLLQFRLFRFAVAWSRYPLDSCKCGRPMATTRTSCEECDLRELEELIEGY